MRLPGRGVCVACQVGLEAVLVAAAQREWGRGHAAGASGPSPGGSATSVGEMIRGAQGRRVTPGVPADDPGDRHDPQLVCEAVTRFAERRVRRIIYAPFSHQQVELPQPLADANLVLANGFDAGARFSSFVPDEVGGAMLAVRTLLAIRSAPVGFINLPEGDVAGAGRLRWYRAALDEAGLCSTTAT